MKFEKMKIAVASGKGGTGKTFVSVNLFRTFLKMNEKVALVDCDVEVPNVRVFISGQIFSEKDVSEFRPVIDKTKCLFCGKCADYCNYHAIFCESSLQYIRLLDDLCHGCGACDVACTSGAIRPSSVAIGKISTYAYKGDICLAEGRMTTGHLSAVPIIKEVIQVLPEKNYRCMVFDSPPGTSCPFIQTVSRADYVILVTEPTPFGLSDLKQAIETLRLMNKPFGVIVNRSDLGDKHIYKFLEENGYDLLMEIPYDERIARLYSEGEIAVDYFPLLAEKFKKLACKLMTKEMVYGDSGNKRKGW